MNIDDIHCNDRNVNDIARGTIYGINNNTSIKSMSGQIQVELIKSIININPVSYAITFVES